MAEFLASSCLIRSTFLAICCVSAAIMVVNSELLWDCSFVKALLTIFRSVLITGAPRWVPNYRGKKSTIEMKGHWGPEIKIKVAEVP